MDLGKAAIVPAGEYVDGTEYERLDMVTYGSGVYIAKEDSQNVLPTDSSVWMHIGDYATVANMTVTKNGIGRPDDDTIKVNANGVFRCTCKMEKVNFAPSVENAVKNTVYLVEDSAVAGVNKYQMWTLIGNEMVCISDRSPDLSNYVLLTDFEEHRDSSVVSEDGVHGIRYYEGKFQGYDSNKAEWFDISTGGGGGVDIGDVSGAAVVADRSQAKLTWTDPEDVVLSDVTLAKWGGTLIRRKEGSAPTDKNDGVKVLDSKTKNAYSSTPYIDTGLEYGKTYYYRFFPYTTGGNYTDGSSVSVAPTRTVITTVPSQSGTLTYDETEQEPVFANYDSTKLTIGGVTAGTNAGTYTATFTPKTDYEWSDGTQEAKSVTWSIGQANADVTLSATEVTLNDEHGVVTVTATNETGALSVSSSDTNIATVSITDDVITISNVNETSGDATITVSIAESTDGNYAAGSKEISVTADFVKIVSWANGTDAEICAMVEAARKGQINLQSYWNVGDERKVTLGAMAATGVGESNASQEVTLVLSHKGGQELVTAAKNTSGGTRTECSFQVDMKNSLATAGYMNKLIRNSGSWGASKRRAWCNNIFYNAIPSSLRPIFAQFKCKTAKTYNGTEIETTNDYFALRAAKEIFGGAASSAGSGTSYSNLAEFNSLTQVDWYKTASHRVKKLGGNASEQSSGGYHWWERSPSCNSDVSFCTVNTNGIAIDNGASHACGLSPFGCIG